MSYASQSAQILAYLAKGKSLTHRDAQRLFNCDRLGARIYDLRGSGHVIHAETTSRTASALLAIRWSNRRGRWRDELVYYAKIFKEKLDWDDGKRTTYNSKLFKSTLREFVTEVLGDE